jgi:hypothetical protein
MRTIPFKKYWSGDVGKKDDFGVEYGDIMIDGKTKSGPWANMTPKSWRIHGVGVFGTGFGQKYEKQTDGKWLKVEG